MTVAVPNPRLLALLGIAVAALLGFLVARPMLMGNGDSNEAAPGVQNPVAPAPAVPKPASKSAPKAQRVHLLRGLPAPLARELRFEKVVVLSVYAAKAPSDRNAVAQARVGAREVDAGFVALNVLDERKARRFAGFVGPSDTPSILVVRRPGKVVNRIDGYVDSAIVAQAAQNAGAGKPASK
jgi:hypothetical protein